MPEVDEEIHKTLGLPRSTIGPLITLVSTCIGALVAVLIILGRDRGSDDI